MQSFTTTLCFSLLIFFLLFLPSTTNASLEQISYYSARYPSPAKPTDNIHSFLAGQNSARAAVGLAPLAWDHRLAAYAQWWANQRRGDCALAHSSGPYGENIFWGSGSDWSVGQAVSAWVVERRWYDYNSNSCSYGEECGHYTQIVWKDTKRVGCAKVVCYGDRGVFITCNYDPPGNYIGSRPY